MGRTFVFAALAVAAAGAAAQPHLRDRVRIVPGSSVTALLPQPVVAFNDGRYALVDHKSPYDRMKAKRAEATCPEGMKAVSAGFSAASGAGEPRDDRLILSKPGDDGSSWAVYARFDGKGDSLAADFDWELRIRVVCLRPG